MSLWNPKNSFQEKVQSNILFVVIAVPVGLGLIYYLIGLLASVGQFCVALVDGNGFDPDKKPDSIWEMGLWILTGAVVVVACYFIYDQLSLRIWRFRRNWNAPDDRLGGAENVDD